MGKEYSAILKERGHSITKEMVAELMRDLGLCSIRQDAKSLYKKDQRQLKNTQSFSKASTPYDNSVVESFFSSLKREELYRKKYRSEKEFRTALDEYMDFYNADRPHAHNKYRTPTQAERDYYSGHAD